MNFGTILHNQNTFNLYKGGSNEFEIFVTVLKHRMYEREHRWSQARVGGGSGGLLPWENLEKSALTNFYVIYSTLKSSSKRTCRLVHDCLRCAIEKAVL